MIITELPFDHHHPHNDAVNGNKKQGGDSKGGHDLSSQVTGRIREKKKLHGFKPVFSLKERLQQKWLHETRNPNTVHKKQKEGVVDKKGVHTIKTSKTVHKKQTEGVHETRTVNEKHMSKKESEPTFLTKQRSTEEHVMARDSVKYTMDRRIGHYYKMKIFSPATNLTEYKLVTDNQLSDIVKKTSAYDAMGDVVQVVGRVMNKKVLVLLEKTGSTPVVNPYFSTVLSGMSWFGFESGLLEINLGSSVPDIPEILQLTITGFKKNDKNSLLLCFIASVWEPVGKTLKKETYFTESSFSSLKLVYSKHKSKRLKKILTEYALASDARNKIYSTEYSSWRIDPTYMGLS